MKKVLLAALLAPAMALAQTYPSPTFSSITIQTPLSPASGGTGATSSTGTGSVVLSAAPTITNLTVTGGLTATGLVGLGSLAAQAANTVIANATGSAASPTAFSMPSCSGSASALQWVSGSGFACITGLASLNSPALTGTPTAPTAATGDNTGQIATDAFVNNSITGISTSVFGSLYSTWFNSLPTTLPASTGVLWNNGGLLSKS